MTEDGGQTAFCILSSDLCSLLPDAKGSSGFRSPGSIWGVYWFGEFS
jgi:hypothetical protein